MSAAAAACLCFLHLEWRFLCACLCRSVCLPVCVPCMQLSLMRVGKKKVCRNFVALSSFVAVSIYVMRQLLLQMSAVPAAVPSCRFSFAYETSRTYACGCLPVVRLSAHTYYVVCVVHEATPPPNPKPAAMRRRKEIKYSSRMLVKFPFGMLLLSLRFVRSLSLSLSFLLPYTFLFLLKNLPFYRSLGWVPHFNQSGWLVKEFLQRGQRSCL